MRLGVVVVVVVIPKLCWGALSSFWGLLLIWPLSRSLPWMNIMIAIPAAAILLTNLDFWEKIRAVCELVMEQRTALARSWSGDPFALLFFAIILFGQL